ncbi:MAG: hypothetical protein JF609_10920 [Verrucomicrobia bacterium]|nr:hypothetical protein [Verrucomicrobiota bacterium]
MHAPSEKLEPREFSALLRGETETFAAWSGHWNTRRLVAHLAIIVIGAGLYGAAMGWWRAPQQGLYVAIKFPLIILLTTLGNALINGMLAPLLGLNIPFRQSFSAIVMSHAITAAILGAFSPLIGFVIWNAPAMTGGPAGGATYSLILLIHVAVIALAGIAGNLRLFQLLATISGSRVAASRVLFAWLAGNLFLGSQLSWILRPFIGSPDLPVQFYREGALHGNFYEAVFHAVQRILSIN